MSQTTGFKLDTGLVGSFTRDGGVSIIDIGDPSDGGYILSKEELQALFEAALQAGIIQQPVQV